MRKNLLTPLLAFMMCLASCSFVSKDFKTDDKDGANNTAYYICFRSSSFPG